MRHTGTERTRSLPGMAALLGRAVLVGSRNGLLPSVGTVSHRPFPGLHPVGTVSHRPFPGLHPVGTVSHRPFPRRSDEAHRDREDSIPTGDGDPTGPRGFGGQPHWAAAIGRDGVPPSDSLGCIR